MVAGIQIRVGESGSFFVRHACILGANDPHKALKTTLKAEINQEAWATLNRDTSRPFKKPGAGRIAAKLICHLGDDLQRLETNAGVPCPGTLKRQSGVAGGSMRHMQLTIRLLRETDGRWIGDVPELPGVTVYGATPGEATLRAKALALRVIAEEIEHGELNPAADTLQFSMAA